jgi:hypothetical protein
MLMENTFGNDVRDRWEHVKDLRDHKYDISADVLNKHRIEELFPALDPSIMELQQVVRLINTAIQSRIIRLLTATYDELQESYKPAVAARRRKRKEGRPIRPCITAASHIRMEFYCI